MTNLPTDILMQLVRAQYTCLVQLRDLGRRQLELIDQGNVTGLLDVLSVKQKPLSDIQRIEKALDPYRGQDPEQRQWRSPQDRAACARLVEQCETLLKEIVAQEKRCEEIMVQQARRHRGPAAATPRGRPGPRGLCRGDPEYRCPAGTSQIDLSSREVTSSHDPTCDCR